MVLCKVARMVGQMEKLMEICLVDDLVDKKVDLWVVLKECLLEN